MHSTTQTNSKARNPSAQTQGLRGSPAVIRPARSRVESVSSAIRARSVTARLVRDARWSLSADQRVRAPQVSGSRVEMEGATWVCQVINHNECNWIQGRVGGDLCL